ncbi:Na+/H+ antiporter [Mycobacteroides abscessus subsp. bolletii]|uniref:AAA family ATPase n=1 Tax=Mycobacteroides abscessus TaxID=36809 RepID=UPI00092AB7FE|nr:AAA family ATPase [Mycobacteroides abscessus]SIJ06051.1 Na+/H+ antiporter [Mycobacteroides abscessus subsp. bolletii]SLD78636.1 Na+/H+ antiporter [Mycobacteroides abscessus subsp. bolletii]SLD85867.1 Na+/H+ antiporter [Mycobacteroides abscessus subsp. bolletii]
MLTTVAIRGYRSLRELIFPVGPLTVITGANGSGKSSLYRALRLLADCGRGQTIGSLAKEGGLQSAQWAGHKDLGQPAGLELGYAAEDFGYLMSLGWPIPEGSMFDRDPQIKREAIFAGPVLRPASTLVRRGGPLVQKRDDSGRGFTELTRALVTYRSVLTEFADPEHLPELTAIRDRLRSWRFYDGFRTDPQAPARRPHVGTRTPMLTADGADLAAAVQTIIEAGSGAGAPILQRAISQAFDGASVAVANTGGLFDLQFKQPGLSRPLGAAELSDGTLRFLLWAAALLGRPQPSLMVLNEPETSLHPDLIEPLASLISAAAANTQVIVVTHSAELVQKLSETDTGDDMVQHQLIKQDSGETQICGQGLLDMPAWHWER